MHNLLLCSELILCINEFSLIVLLKSLNSLQNLKALFKGIDYNLYSNYLEQIHLGSLELQSSRQDWRKQMFVIRLMLEAKPMIGMEKMNNNNVFSNMLNVKRMLPCNVYKQQFQSNIPQVILYFTIIMIYNLYKCLTWNTTFV